VCQSEKDGDIEAKRKALEQERGEYHHLTAYSKLKSIYKFTLKRQCHELFLGELEAIDMVLEHEFRDYCRWDHMRLNQS
jgi:hypothetical protein